MKTTTIPQLRRTSTYKAILNKYRRIKPKHDSTWRQNLVLHSTALSNIIYDENIKKNQHIMKNENINLDKCLNQKKHSIKTNRNTLMNTNQHLYPKECLNKIERIMETDHIRHVNKNENVNSDKCLNEKHVINTNRNTLMITNQHLHPNECLNKTENIVELNGNKYDIPRERLIMNIGNTHAEHKNIERKKNQDIKLESQKQCNRHDQQLIKWIENQDNINQNILELTRKQTDLAEKQNLVHDKIVDLIQKQNNSAEDVKKLIESVGIMTQNLVDKKT